MKTLLILISLLISSFFLHAQSDNLRYVITNTDTLYFKHFKMRAFNTKGKLNSGEKVKIPNHQIIAYSKNGHVMKKLPVFMDGKKTECFAMMELVGYANGLSIYKYIYHNGSNDSENAIFNYYQNETCVNTQKNPNLNEIKDFVLNYNANAMQLITSE
jgi:hypothetical protein